MNSYLVVLTFVAVSFICQVKETDGLKCYQCNNCNDPFDSTGVTTISCSGSCVKAKYSGYVARDCEPVGEEDSCASVSKDGESVEVCSCTSDLCNGGSVQGLSVMLSVIIFVAMVLKAMFW
ncbi:hypothetical protein ACF0H5_020330 [Mactra antiquata]